MSAFASLFLLPADSIDSAAACAVLSTIGPIIIALRPADGRTGTSAELCDLSDVQRATIAAAMSGTNSSCMFNMTVSSVIDGGGL